MASTFTWLHLTDLHIGQPRYQYSPDQILSMLLRDMEDLRADPGVPLPDVVFFTGDLAYSGTAPQYEKLEALLGRLWKWFADNGKTPLLAPVPGNHDLSWQRFDQDQRVLWRSFHDGSAEVREQLFESRRAGLATPPGAARAEPVYWLDGLLQRAFSGYTGWLSRTKIPILGGRAPGLLPGEYAATWEGSGLRIGVLGLNSAYYDVPDLRPRPGEGTLALYDDQLDAAVAPDDFDTWCAARNACIVLCHHPPTWLAEAGARHLRERYFTGERVALHLCGHVHEKMESHWGRGWSPETRVFLGKSLFGIERIERASEKTGPRRGEEAEDEAALDRSFGYALGQLRFTPGSTRAELLVYPRRAVFEDKMLMRPDKGTGNRTKALDPQQVEVRALPAAQAPVPGAAVAALASPPANLFWRPVFDEILGDLRASSPPRPGGVFVFAPTRYGATTLVDALVEDAWAKRLRGGAGGTLAVASVHLRAWAVGLDVNQIEKRICQAIHRSLSIDDRAPPETLTECAEQVLSLQREGTILLLVLQSFSSLPRVVNGALQGRLRTALENNKYSSSTKRGLRLLVVGRAPASRVFSADAPGSFLAPALHSVTLVPLSLDEARLCAQRHLAWQGHEDCVRWLWAHTGGHPEVYLRLSGALAEVAPAWPPLLHGPAADEERAAWLHGESCLVKGEVDALAETLNLVLEQHAGHLPAPWGMLGASPPRDEEIATASSGLFLAHARPPKVIPFIARVLARPAGI